MNPGFFLIPRHLLWMLLAPPLMVVTGCDEAMYTHVLKEFCLQQFEIEMEDLGKRLWCDWGDTMGIYTDVTNCTVLLAEKLGCFWPNHVVDHLFMGIHKKYFRNCSVTGRLPADPPFPILCSVLFVPILITVLMTALVVWRSKRSEGIV
ncbi:receptor activity-modifying protein 1 [Spea bombifrons]|uniref:receptor activity-modifying protein 1 n=1 Tax=Spea bombifrons TaxID=233779 RepID=UPI00234A0235|nr:receptor activity-modifying protein 1 [Spea bombifrons]